MSESWSDSDLEKFRSLQKLAYEVVQETEKDLTIGMTEKQACDLMLEKFKSRGITRFFHRPFAWFGDRTMFKGFSKPFDLKEKVFPSFNNPLPHFGMEFLPSDKTFQENMAIILDVAPVEEGLACDIGYAFYRGESKEHQEALNYLKEQRSLILELVKSKKSIHEIYSITEAHLQDNGYKNCHGVYPLGVLGHRIGRLPTKFLPRMSIMGFEPAAYAFLLNQMRKKTDPFLKEDVHKPLSQGLWAIEPHVGINDIGVKFEELLVVTKDTAYWLDDSLPHV